MLYCVARCWGIAPRRVSASYIATNPYHNAMHAADVLQTVNVIMSSGLLLGLSMPGCLALVRAHAISWRPVQFHSPHPHLHMDWAHPIHICTGTGFAPATSAHGLGSPPATYAPGLGSPLLATSAPGLAGPTPAPALFAEQVVAAITHDFRHPGTNNLFAINTRADVAITYDWSRPRRVGGRSASAALPPRSSPNMLQRRAAMLQLNVSGGDAEGAAAASACKPSVRLAEQARRPVGTHKHSARTVAALCRAVWQRVVVTGTTTGRCSKACT